MKCWELRNLQPAMMSSEHTERFECMLKLYVIIIAEPIKVCFDKMRDSSFAIKFCFYS